MTKRFLKLYVWSMYVKHVLKEINEQVLEKGKVCGGELLPEDKSMGHS